MSLSARSSPHSLAIEGKLTDDGLASLSAGEDMTLMLAKALIEGAQIDGAESVWRSMNEKRVDPVSLPPQAENVFHVWHRSRSLEVLEERSWSFLAEEFGLFASA